SPRGDGTGRDLGSTFALKRSHGKHIGDKRERLKRSANVLPELEAAKRFLEDRIVIAGVADAHHVWRGADRGQQTRGSENRRRVQPPCGVGRKSFRSSLQRGGHTQRRSA